LSVELTAANFQFQSYKTAVRIKYACFKWRKCAYFPQEKTWSKNDSIWIRADDAYLVREIHTL